MFVLTAKVSKTKIAAVVTIIIALIVLIAVLLASGKSKPEETAIDASTNDARLSFLSQYGWDVDAQPLETQQVAIPEDAQNEVFSRYNELQRSQGFDLSAYAGKTVTRYVYEILNYEGATEPVYATLFVYKGQLIGGDVTNTASDGLIHGFEKPS